MCERAITDGKRAINVSKRAITEVKRAINMCERAITDGKRAIPLSKRAITGVKRAINMCERAITEVKRAITDGKRATTLSKRAINRDKDVISSSERAIIIGGTVPIASFSADELVIISKFFGVSSRELMKKNKISLREFENQLSFTRFDEISLKQLLDAYFGETILSNKERHLLNEKKLQNFFVK